MLVRGRSVILVLEAEVQEVRMSVLPHVVIEIREGKDLVGLILHGQQVQHEF